MTTFEFETINREHELVDAVVTGMLAFYEQNRQAWRNVIDAGKSVELIDHHDRLVGLDYVDGFGSVEDYIADIAGAGESVELTDLLGRGLWDLRQTCRQWIANNEAYFASWPAVDLEREMKRLRYGQLQHWTSAGFWCEAVLSNNSTAIVSLSNAFDKVY